MKGSVASRGRKKSSTKNHRHVTRDGGGRGRCRESEKEHEKKTRRKISRKMSRDIENPAYYSGNVSCATVSGTITQTSPDTERGGRQDRIRENHP